MKFQLTFFLLICFNLLGGQRSAYNIGRQSQIFQSQGAHLVKAASFEEAGGGHGSLITNHPGTPFENDGLLFVDDDEDDDNSRKCKINLEFFSTFYYTYITSYPCRDLTNLITIRRQPSHISSCKYITQRVLRI